jgi:hypothetical protein
VSYIARQTEDTQTVWTSPDLPITVASGVTRTIWASFSGVVFSPALVTTTTGGTPSVVFTAFAHSAKIDLTGGTLGTTWSALSVAGRPVVDADAQSVMRSSSSGNSWTVRGPDISATYAPGQAAADGLAYWTVYHLATFEPRLDLTVSQQFPTQVARQIGDRVAVQVPRVNTTSWSDIIRTVSTTVSTNGAVWDTTYGLEPAGVPAAGTVFVLDTTPLDNASQKLGY